MEIDNFFRYRKKYDNSVVFERPYHGRHFRPIQIDNIYYMDMLAKKAEYFSRYHFLKTRKYRQIYNEIQNKFAEPLKAIEQAYQYPVQYEEVYESLSKIVLQVSILKKELRKKLQEVSPKIIVEVVYYSRLCMVVNKLAKEMGIPTVELQHGTMHSAHANS